jgi:hypothetical protein
MKKLVQLEVLTQKDVDLLMKWKTQKSDSVVFAEFIAYAVPSPSPSLLCSALFSACNSLMCCVI